MTDEETVQKLMNLKLETMAQAFRDLLADAPGNQHSFSEKVALMIDREWTDRENRRLERLLLLGGHPKPASSGHLKTGQLM